MEILCINLKRSADRRQFQERQAEVLGLNFYKRLRLVILPQAIKNILPAIGNQFVYVLKMSSLVSIIGIGDLTRKANELVVSTYRPLEIYTFLILEYLILILTQTYFYLFLLLRFTTM